MHFEQTTHPISIFNTVGLPCAQTRGSLHRINSSFNSFAICCWSTVFTVTAFLHAYSINHQRNIIYTRWANNLKMAGGIVFSWETANLEASKWRYSIKSCWFRQNSSIEGTLYLQLRYSKYSEENVCFTLCLKRKFPVWKNGFISL